MSSGFFTLAQRETNNSLIICLKLYFSGFPHRGALHRLRPQANSGRRLRNEVQPDSLAVQISIEKSSNILWKIIFRDWKTSWIATLIYAGWAYSRLLYFKKIFTF